MLKKKATIVPFYDVPKNCIFRALKSEIHHARLIENNGLFLKIADSHSIELATKKEAIFSGNMPCRIIHEDWHQKGVN